MCREAWWITYQVRTYLTFTNTLALLSCLCATIVSTEPALMIQGLLSIRNRQKKSEPNTHMMRSCIVKTTSARHAKLTSRPDLSTAEYATIVLRSLITTAFGSISVSESKTTDGSCCSYFSTSLFAPTGLLLAFASSWVKKTKSHPMAEDLSTIIPERLLIILGRCIWGTLWLIKRGRFQL